MTTETLPGNSGILSADFSAEARQQKANNPSCESSLSAFGEPAVGVLFDLFVELVRADGGWIVEVGVAARFVVKHGNENDGNEDGDDDRAHVEDDADDGGYESAAAQTPAFLADPDGAKNDSGDRGN